MSKLDPRAVWLFFISFLSRWLLITLILAFWIILSLSDLSQGIEVVDLGLWIAAILALLIAFLFIWAKLTYHFYKYELREDGFRKEMGVIYKKYVTIPYDRIQNVDIYRGILARLLGLSDLNIQTAGASVQISRYGALTGGAEGRLPGLSREDAEKLRDELIRRTKQSKSQGL
jgi:uncharacterized membrane protein YdbT with pleckstrin-like domain